MTTRLGGRTAVITGGAAGLGLAIARAFATEGASVVLMDIDGARAEASAAQLAGAGAGSRGMGIGADITDGGAVDAAILRARSELGSIDILVNNAAVAGFGGVDSMSREAWERVIAVNLTGTFLVSRAVVPVMLEQGRGAIINIGSIAGLVGVAGMAAYSATKGAVVSLTRQMAADYSGRGIRVNCICPGIVPGTVMGRTVMETNDTAPDARAKRLAKYPIGRLAEPGDVAAAALFLASDEASFVTGLVMPVDGGMTAI
jgi:NAD(P)-dependent dehydrogenase (short-subunit alcohol dehydrogenase family)